MTAMSDKYEALEQLTLQLDDENDYELSDKIRDIMDVIWFSRLTEFERARLNCRGEVVRNETAPLRELTVMKVNIIIAPPQLAPVYARNEQIDIPTDYFSGTADVA